MNRRYLRCELWVLLAFLVLGQVPVAASTADEGSGKGVGKAIATTLSEWLPDQLKERRVPGAAVAVVDNKGILWEEVFGVTDGPGSPPITPDTIFCIRSISKSVTALAVLVAVQDGLLDLDTPIREYLPELSLKSRFDERPEQRITLRHMLSHWAGFTHDPPAGLDLEHPGYFERYIGRISEAWLRFPVGYRLHYANYGVDLAGYILQIRSGRPFAEYVQDKVLDPIGMVNSSFNLNVVARRKDRAIGHDSKGKVFSVPLPEIPAAGLYASVRDMSKYARFHLNGGMVSGHRFLRKDLMAQYHSIQFAHPRQRTGYALGLWREAQSHTFSLYHEGGGRGFSAHMMLYPELGVGAVLLTNLEYHGLTGLEGRTVMNGPVVNRHGPTPIAKPGLGEMRKLDIADPRVNAILGRYGDSPGVVIGFEHDVLGIRLNENSFVPLALFDEGGRLVGMYGAASETHFLPPMGSQPGAMMLGSRVVSNLNSHYADFNDSPTDPPGPDKPEWKKFVGEYDVIWEDEPDSTATVEIRNGYLYFRDGKCVEREPGLFFLYDGEALDFRTTPPTFATQEIGKKQPFPAERQTHGPQAIGDSRIMDNTTRKDLEDIEDTHRRDVAATKAGDFETLKSLMDAQCMVFPPDSEPEAGQAYLDRVRTASDGIELQPEILELVQEWEEVRLLGDFAFEQGVIRSAVKDAEGAVIRETQRLMRLLKRQQDGTWRVFRAMWHAPRRATEGTTEELNNREQG